MLEILAMAVLFVAAGILLFLPSLAMGWWQSRNRDDGRPEAGEPD